MRYVVIGASAAGLNGIEEIRRLDKDAEIILISKDDRIYSRCILHHYMQGIRTLEKLNFKDEDFIEKNNIHWIKGLSVTRLYAKEKSLELEDGRVINFDKLLIASGAKPSIPPMFKEDRNVIGFRNLSDCFEIMERAKIAKNIVVSGAGLVGLDALSGLLHINKNLTVLELKDRMLSMQLDKRAASVYEEAFKREGVKQYFGTIASEAVLDEEGNVVKLILSDGSSIPCDLLVITVGVRANVKFLEGSGVEFDRFGLVIDSYGKTNFDYIYGAGDVTGRSPIWPAAVKQGIIAGSNMASVKREMDDFFASKCTMNFLGVPTMSLGIPEALDESYSVEIEDDGKNYKKIIHKDGVIYGAILQGDLSYSGILTQMIKNKIDTSKVKKPLFKIDYSDFFNIKDNFEFIY